MLRGAFALWFGMVLAPKLPAQPAAETAGLLAARISSLLPRRATVSIEFQSLVQVAPAEWSSFRSALEQELRKAGAEIATAAQPDSSVRVAVSENARGLLLVAEVANKDTRQVTMLPWSAAAVADTRPHVRITQKPVWEQAEPVLDILLLDSDSQLLVLSPSKVATLRQTGASWTLTGQAGLSLARPLARDPRGRLQINAGLLSVYVPGTTCSTPRTALRLACAAGDEWWPPNPRDARFLTR